MFFVKKYIQKLYIDNLCDIFKSTEDICSLFLIIRELGTLMMLFTKNGKIYKSALLNYIVKKCYIKLCDIKKLYKIYVLYNIYDYKI